MDYKTMLRNAILNLSFTEESVDSAEQRIEEGMTANQMQKLLFKSMEEGRPDLAVLLIQKGVDINARNDNDETPLHVAARKGQLEVVKALIQKQANMDAKERGGNTPFHWAVLYGNLSVAVFLYKRGAKLEETNARGETIIHTAVRESDLDIVKYLISHGADLKAKDKRGKNLIMKATEAFYVKPEEVCGIIRLLAKEGVSLFERDKFGNTALHTAIISAGEPFHNTKWVAVDSWLVPKFTYGTPVASQEIVKTLIELGCDVNARNYSGNTPLHLAAKLNAFDIAQILLTAKADYRIKNNAGKTPSSIIRGLYSHREVSDVIQQAKKIDFNKRLQKLFFWRNAQHTKA